MNQQKETAMKRVTGTGILGLALVIGAAPACATKGFVRASVADVDKKVESISRSMEETQERTRANESRIGEVDQKTASAQSAADGARQAADQADAKAARADAQATALDRASRRLVYTVVLSEDQGNFAFGKATLPDDAKARIDELLNKIKGNPQAVYFEIEGHTDAVGPKEYNDHLGLERAEAVKRYLYDHHQIPLHKMNVISYGAEKPVAPNDTKSGRAANRRVVVKVLTYRAASLEETPRC
jgi:outer membrane protein OmpA-like peptidoglycan-associated protein